MVFFLNGIVAAAAAIPMVGYLVGPILKKDEKPWIGIGAMKDYDAEPKSRRLKWTSTEGFRPAEKRASVYVMAENGRVTVFSSKCPHLGCNFKWKSDQNKFFCPCHGAEFSREGEILKKPSPRPLDRMQTKIEHGEIFVRV